ncbi:MAG: bifunctional metallophosphatase/5'-nucleotidase, partial [Lachnospiraceae bacterium]|nr:bifunctional metallophosphatase/5'-nucleotidase [Lachnospiraceae bacterium]
AAVKAELEEQYAHVLLVDAGDHIQGTAYGSMDEGKTIISLMNAAGYDLATLGNHEFDYGMFGCMRIIDDASFSYVSCNFYHASDGVRKENVLNGFALFPLGEEVLAIIGITTPETFTKSTPSYFQDENGNFIYGIAGGSDGALLYADVQRAIDEAKQAGATRIIALGHLGVDPASRPWTSEEVIANTHGLDAFIDGHSHTVMKGSMLDDADGNGVLLTQTGQYFDRIGMMVIDSETGDITTDFIQYEALLGEDGETVEGYELRSDLYTGTALVSNTEVASLKNQWLDQIDTLLGEKIGSSTVVLDNYEGETRLVRSSETNSGDFAADALYYLFDNMDMAVDVAVMNGGGVRNTAITGDLTYKLCKDIHTFGNVACLQTVTGRQLLDALEWGARGVGTGEEIGGFLQVAGLIYHIDSSVDSTVQSDENEIWTGGPTGDYRVRDVQVYNKLTQSYEPLDLNASYNLAGYNYTLRDLGDGFAMFDGAVNILDYVMEDYMVLANYIQGFENGTVEAANSPLLGKYPGMLLDYTRAEGSGRIVIH